mgnify:CR=1 FL=1
MPFSRLELLFKLEVLEYAVLEFGCFPFTLIPKETGSWLRLSLVDKTELDEPPRIRPVAG